VGDDCRFEVFAVPRQHLAVVKQPPDGLPRPFRDGFVGLHERYQLFQLVGAQGNHEAELSRQVPHGVGQHRLLLDQQGTSGMPGQDTLLLQALGWHERHIWPGHGFAERSGVGGVVLLAPFDERPDRLGRDQLHAVSLEQAGLISRTPGAARAINVQVDRSQLPALQP